MSPLRAAWRDYRDAARSFSRPARLFLFSTLLSWTGYGISQVLFNLYLVEGGFQEAFVGRIIALNGVGLALAALPAGWLAERRGRRFCLVLGALVYGAGHLARALVLHPGVICGGSFLAGVGQALIAIAAAPFLSEHSTSRERTHLFSAFFAAELLAGVVGSLVGGALPAALGALPWLAPGGLLVAYRVTLVAGALLDFAAILPLQRLRGLKEVRHERGGEATASHHRRKLRPIAVNAFLIGAGAGLVIPFMNLYFKTRFQCSSRQIGTFFAVAQVGTAFAMLLGPALARRLGKLRTATLSQLLSLPFLVTLGAERHLETAVAAFWFRATLMQASTPLINTFVMETLPPSLRARSASFTNLVWNLGWATSATFAGVVIQRFGYAVPFYVTATLYAGAALWFYFSFRHTPEIGAEEARLSEEAKGLRGEGPMTE
jgi:MFS family permease